ncbi:MAG: hypothetical protein ACLGIO_11295 [Acidimicrobiia bacterium]
MGARRIPSWAAAGVPVAVALVVAVALRPGAPAGGDGERDVRPAAPAATGGTEFDRGAGADGPGRDRRGAAVAAVSYLGVLPGLVEADPAERERVLGGLSAPGSPGVAARMLEGLAVLDRAVAEGRAALPGARVLVREVPVSYTVAAFDGARARVEVWSVGVVLIEGRTEATEVWSTNSVELVWDGGAWKVWAWSRRPGPVPAPAADGPDTPAAVLAAVGDWEDLRHAPAP